MPDPLCQTTAAFHISGHGTVVVLEDPSAWSLPRGESMKIWEAIRIQHPDQSSVRTFVRAIDLMQAPGGRDAIGIVLPRDVTLAQVPPGSLVFLERGEDQAPGESE